MGIENGTPVIKSATKSAGKVHVPKPKPQKRTKPAIQQLDMVIRPKDLGGKIWVKHAYN